MGFNDRFKCADCGLQERPETHKEVHQQTGGVYRCNACQRKRNYPEYTDEEKFYGEVVRRMVNTGTAEDIAKAVRAAVYVDPIETLAIALGLRETSYELLMREGTEIAKSAYALGARAPKESK